MKLFAVSMPGKKADLNLSINAIVVLILAIVMLGLGLGFIRNVFGGATEKLSEGLESVSIRNPADSNSPITIDDLTMKRTATKEIEIGVYNRHETSKLNIKLQVTGCTQSSGEEFSGELPIIAAPTLPELAASTGTGFKAVFSWPEGAEPPVGTYVCIIEAQEEAGAFESAQFFVRVVS